MRVRFRDIRGELAQRSYVIENPERAAMRGDDEIIAVNDQVAHGGMRQILLQGLPVVAIVERNVDGAFRSGKEQALTNGIFANDVAGAAIGNSLGDFLPGSSKVARAVNVRAEIIEAERVDRRVSGGGVEMRRLDDGDFAPRLELRRSDIA